MNIKSIQNNSITIYFVKSWVNFSHSVTLSQGKVAWPVVDNGEIRDGHLLSVLYGHEISATFDIITIINMRNEENGIVKCSSEWSKRDCLAQCYSSNIKALCNCSAPMLAILFPALAVPPSFNYGVIYVYFGIVQ